MKTCLIYEKGAFAPIMVDSFIHVFDERKWMKFVGVFKEVYIRPDLVDKYIIKEGGYLDAEKT